MPLRLYVPWVVISAVLALHSIEAAAQSSGRCFSFINEAGSGTVEIVSRCADWRKATVRWCNGRVLRIAVAGSRAIRLPAVPGCVMRITGEFGTNGRKAGRGKKAFTEASKESAPAALESKLKPEEPRKQTAGTKAAPSVRTSDQSAAGEWGLIASLSFMGPVKEPEAIPLPKDTSLAEEKAGRATQTQIAVYPEASKDDWDTLLCIASGALLIRQTEALLNRKAALEASLHENWLNLDAADKQEERIAADKELHAIGRELGKFKDRAKAIIDGTARE
jgi:hypothetical protein